MQIRRIKHEKMQGLHIATLPQEKKNPFKSCIVLDFGEKCLRATLIPGKK